ERPEPPIPRSNRHTETEPSLVRSRGIAFQCKESARSQSHLHKVRDWPNSPHTNRRNTGWHAESERLLFAETSARSTADRIYKPLAAGCDYNRRDESVHCSPASNSNREVPCESRRNHAESADDKWRADTVLQ